MPSVFGHASCAQRDPIGASSAQRQKQNQKLTNHSTSSKFLLQAKVYTKPIDQLSKHQNKIKVRLAMKTRYDFVGAAAPHHETDLLPETLPTN